MSIDIWNDIPQVLIMVILDDGIWEIFVYVLFVIVFYFIILMFCVPRVCMFFVFFSELAAAKSFQSCPALCDPIDGSPPGSAIPGILQARTRSGLPFPSPMHESEK